MIRSLIVTLALPSLGFRIVKNSANESVDCGGANIYLEPQGSNRCMRGRKVADYKCLSAINCLQRAYGRATSGPLSTGRWEHAPHGCFLEHGANFKPHYNTYAFGNNNGRYGVVCEVGAPDTELLLGTQGANKCVRGESVSKGSCREAGKQTLKWMGKPYTGGIVEGSWSHVPTGCSVQFPFNSGKPFWNNRYGANNNGQFSLVCKAERTQGPTSQFYVDVPGSNACPHGEAPAEGNCAAMVDDVYQALGRFNRPAVAVGDWGHLPPGCSLELGRAFKPHYNRKRNGNNNGGFGVVCKSAALPLGMWAPVASNFQGSVSFQYRIEVTNERGEYLEIGSSVEITRKVESGFSFGDFSGSSSTSVKVKTWMVGSINTTLRQTSTAERTVSCPYEPSKGRSIQLYRWVVVVGDKYVNSDHFRCHYTDGAQKIPQCPYGTCGNDNTFCEEQGCYFCDATGCSGWKA